MHRCQWLTLVIACIGLHSYSSVDAQETKPQPEIEYRADVEYGTGGDKKLRLHLAYPKAKGEKRAALVFIHGGGWAAGSRNDLTNQIQHAARHGYVAISV